KEQATARRLGWARRLGAPIEGLAQKRPNPPLPELAYHFSQAASAGAVDKAIDYATRAGDRAADGLAHEEAARLFDIALHSLEFRPAGRDTGNLRVNLHQRRARSFDASD